jgi:hypothetical protein
MQHATSTRNTSVSATAILSQRCDLLQYFSFDVRSEFFFRYTLHAQWVAIIRSLSVALTTVLFYADVGTKQTNRF